MLRSYDIAYLRYVKKLVHYDIGMKKKSRYDTRTGQRVQSEIHNDQSLWISGVIYKVFYTYFYINFIHLIFLS